MIDAVMQDSSRVSGCDVTLDEALGIVRMKLFGAPSSAQLRESFVTLRELLPRCRPRLLLIDGGGVPSVTAEMRGVIGEEAKTVEFDRQAIIGIRPAERVFARIVAKITGMSQRMQFFATEDEAVRWLRAMSDA